MPLNIPLLLAVKEQILKEPRRFDMCWFQMSLFSISPRWQTGAPSVVCNTTFCIGGWAIWLENGLDLLEYNRLDMVEHAFDNAARTYSERRIDSGDGGEVYATKLLGLPNDDLLFAPRWPLGFKLAYYNSLQQPGMNVKEDVAGLARIGADIIDYAIATNGTLRGKPLPPVYQAHVDRYNADDEEDENDE